MVDARAKCMIRDFVRCLRGDVAGPVFRRDGNGLQELEADMKMRGRQGVLEDLALEALFRQKGFEVTQEDIDANWQTSLVDRHLTGRNAQAWRRWGSSASSVSRSCIVGPWSG
jgi:hypothetical protein